MGRRRDKKEKASFKEDRQAVLESLCKSLQGTARLKDKLIHMVWEPRKEVVEVYWQGAPYDVVDCIGKDGMQVIERVVKVVSEHP